MKEILIKKMSNEKVLNNQIKKNYEKLEEEINESFNSEKSTTSIEITYEELKEEIINKEENKLEKIIESISSILEKLIKKNNHNSSEKNLKNYLNYFQSEEKPEISIFHYLNRIVKYTNCEENTLILSLIYLDKVCLKKINLSIYNIHRFLFASLLIAIKFNEDKIYKNDYYSQIAGISNNELNLIEFYFLQIIDFQTFINENVFNMYKDTFKF